MNKKIIFVSIILLWVLLFGVFIFYKEFTLRTGEKIILKTVPIDPRDLFRGDYVVLSYEISNLELSNFENKNLEFEKGDTIYVGLKKDDKYWAASNVYKEKPATLVLRGRVENKRGSTLNVEYGIESFFVPEGEGKELERYRNLRSLDVEISVDKFGNGVINNLYIDDEIWVAP